MTLTNQIICGDATEELKRLPSGSVDMVLTDMPYLVNYRDRMGRTIANDDDAQNVLPAFPEMFRVLKDNTYCVVFCGWVEIAQFSQAWAQAGFRTVGHIVWEKNYASRAAHTEYRHESAYLLAKGKPVWPKVPVPDVMKWEYTGNRLHPTEKAVSILTPLVRAYSPIGGIVLDPFAGSGSTCVASALEGRSSIGIDVEQKYCATARKRLDGVARYRKEAA